MPRTPPPPGATAAARPSSASEKRDATNQHQNLNPLYSPTKPRWLAQIEARAASPSARLVRRPSGGDASPFLSPSVSASGRGLEVRTTAAE